MTDQAIEIVIHGRHAGVSDRFKDFVRDKLAHVQRFAVPMHRIDVEVSHEANPRQHDRAYEVELTCSGSPFVTWQRSPAKLSGSVLATWPQTMIRVPGCFSFS